jgi:hypothetical protein
MNDPLLTAAALAMLTGMIRSSRLHIPHYFLCSPSLQVNSDIRSRFYPRRVHSVSILTVSAFWRPPLPFHLGLPPLLQ